MLAEWNGRSYVCPRSCFAFNSFVAVEGNSHKIPLASFFFFFWHCSQSVESPHPNLASCSNRHPFKSTRSAKHPQRWIALLIGLLLAVCLACKQTDATVVLITLSLWAAFACVALAVRVCVLRQYWRFEASCLHSHSQATYGPGCILCAFDLSSRQVPPAGDKSRGSLAA